MQSTSEIGRVFDVMSPEYTSIMDDMVPGYRDSMSAMFTALPEGFIVANAMDLGCGNGNVTALCRSVYPDAQIHLLDASAEMLALCRQRFGEENLSFEQNTFQKYLPTKNSFDLVVAGMSVHHLDGAEKSHVFGKIARSLRKGGVFACADLMIDKQDPEHPAFLESWQEFIYSNGRTREDWDWLMDHYDKYDRPSAYDDMETWLKNAGFTRVERSWESGYWGCLHAWK